jgi:ABC-type multidrug transport system fused ATPase/permease subunit
LVINVLFVLSLTCCLAAYISAGSAVQQLTISNRLSIIIPGIGGCLLYFLFVVWLFHDFNLFFRSARSGSVVDYFTDFVTMIWFFLFPRRSSCTRERFQLLAQDLAETARQWSVRQLFNKASDEINCYDQNNTPNELNAAEQTSQQQQQRSTETSNNAAAAAAAFRAQQSAEHGSSGGDGSQSQCWPWKNPCKGYLKKLEDKLLHNAPNLSEQQTATTPIEPSVGGDASGSTPIVQEIELVQTEQ